MKRYLRLVTPSDLYRLTERLLPYSRRKPVHHRQTVGVHAQRRAAGAADVQLSDTCVVTARTGAVDDALLRARARAYARPAT